MMVKVEIRPGIFIRLTEKEAQERGLMPEVEPHHKAAKPQAAKPKKSAKPQTAELQVEETPEVVFIEEAAEEAGSE